MSKGRVIVGLSGGVDSSVAAKLLIEQGYEVIGAFMRNWDDTRYTITDEMEWIKDSEDARKVAESLDIPFHIFDFRKKYFKRVVDYMFREYEVGRTPNPDILCNREIKFDLFWEEAKKFNADFVATGHYARKDVIQRDGQTYYRLLSGLDPKKDQSYFLAQLSQEQLKHALFPIGELEKPEVRRLAKEAELITADKRDSQGICFVGKVNLPDFLKQQLAPKEGDVVVIPRDYHDQFNTPENFENERERLEYLGKTYQYKPTDGKVVGKHQGAHYFTKGQRKGLNIGGFKERTFVIDTDVKNNIVYIGEHYTHPGLYRSALQIKNDELHWVRPDLALKAGETLDVDIRYRHLQPLRKGRLHQFEDVLWVEFFEPQQAIAEGQFAAWYHDDELVGSGVIS
ncbi:MAG TPA: tRNA 2-thiouridine(34) synthase MnmA [Flavobacteriales bacterium]|nr:tRNA 2-thiouridine(34) synthase MnmA [Flavobacteriales bacterium]